MTSHARVLAADADEAVRTSYREALRHEGFDIIEASDGRDALVKAFVRIPSLVITELSLPKIDGVALCEILRADRATARVPIVVATAETRADRLARAQQVADAVIQKPTNGEVVLRESVRLLNAFHNLSGRVADACAGTSEIVGRSATLLRTAAERRQSRSKMVATARRFTTTAPPLEPPRLNCAACDRPLIYELSYVGGVNDEQPEQWDYFVCSKCGTFQYRQRTRKVRRLSPDEEKWMRTSEASAGGMRQAAACRRWPIRIEERRWDPRAWREGPE